MGTGGEACTAPCNGARARPRRATLEQTRSPHVSDRRSTGWRKNPVFRQPVDGTGMCREAKKHMEVLFHQPAGALIFSRATQWRTCCKSAYARECRTLTAMIVTRGMDAAQA
jgi:hypothetical protein